MGKGTAARRGGKIVHIRCRRCGRHSYHRQHQVCSSCGFGASARWRGFDWAKLK